MSARSRREFLSGFTRAQEQPPAGAPDQPASTAGTSIQDEPVQFENQDGLYDQTINMAPLQAIAMNRLSYGQPAVLDPSRSTSLRFNLPQYLEDQLTANDALPDDTYTQQFAAARVRIQYSADPGGAYPAVDEWRPLNRLNQSVTVLWPLGDFNQTIAYAERVRPLDEVRADCFLRAVYSRWQLREIMTHFWFDHFNVDPFADGRVHGTWPVYVRMLRANAFGNFRVLLEEMTKSVAMMYYLNLVSSRIQGQGPNENFPRELLELHTMGAENYNPDPNATGGPGGATQPNPQYCEQDIKRLARILAGWSINSSNGTFQFNTTWNDPAQKVFLGMTIPAATTADPMAQGRQVLDILAAHPVVARYVCTKLCRRLVTDAPPESLIQRAVTAWTSNLAAPDQIKHVLRAIVLSPEFSATWGGKVKRPFEYAVSFLRAVNAQFVANGGSLTYRSLVQDAGHGLFSWPAPNGYPDVAGYWLNTNAIRFNWRNSVNAMAGAYNSGITINARTQMPTVYLRTPRTAVDYWVQRLLGRTLPATIYQEILNYMANGQNPDGPIPGTDSEITTRINRMVGRIAVTPDFLVK